MNIVIDTNILISALIKNSVIRFLITSLELNLIFPEIEFREIENNKEEILKKSKLSKKDFNIILLTLFRYLKIIKTEKILDYQQEAIEIIKDINPDDATFIATTLAFNCPIWSNDKHFKIQTRIKIFNTKEIIELLKSS